MLSSCGITGSDVTDNSMQSLRYDDGPTSGAKFKQCVEPGTKLSTNDKLYPYPVTQREDQWDTASKDADHGDLELTDKNGVTVYTKIKVDFFLNTSCDPVTVDGKTYKGGTLQAFHELVGKTRHAYFNDDGTYDGGWITAMNYYISQPVQTYLTAETKKYTAEALYNNPDIQKAIQNGLQEKIQSLVDDGMQTDLSFYHDFNVSIQSFTPDSDFLGMLRDRQAAAVKAQTAQDNAKAQVAEANAAAKVAVANARVKRAEISGYGGFNNYKCIYLADNGLNCAQPQYVVGSPS
jgi:hypothetical protein